MSKQMADREIVVTRVIDAPQELVFAAFTEPAHMNNWWTPAGSVTHEIDVKPGGIWRYSLPAADGSLMPFKITFITLDKPNQLIYDYQSDTAAGQQPVRTTVTFEAQGEQTKVTLQLLFATAADRKTAVKYGGIVGAMQALENLADYLLKQ